MVTIINARNILEIAITDKTIPLNPDLTVNYQEYVDNIKKAYNNKYEIKRDLTKVY